MYYFYGTEDISIMFIKLCKMANGIPVMECVILHLQKQRKWKISVSPRESTESDQQYILLCTSHRLHIHVTFVPQYMFQRAQDTVSYSKFGEKLKGSIEPFLCHFHYAGSLIPRSMERGESERIGTCHAD